MKNIKEVEIEVKGKEWTTILDEVFKKKRKDVSVDGFRKGNVPKEVYLKKFGIESLYMDAVDNALKVAYPKALKSSEVIPVIEPRVDIKHICEDCVTFVFTIFTKPEVKLGAYKNLKVKKETAKVTEEEVAKEIENIRNKYAEIVVKEEGKLEKGNTAVIDFEGFVDGKALEGGNGTDYPLEIGSNTFIPGFEDGLVGMSINETKELKLKFPENYTDELKNKDVLFKVTLKAIKERILPDLNKELFEDLGYKDIKDEKGLKEEVKKQIITRKEADIENVYIESLLEAASKNMKVDINEEIIADEVDRMIHQYEDQLKMQGLTLEQYFSFTKGSIDDLRKNMQPEAEKRIKYRYLLEGIAEAEKIKISDEKAKEETKRLAEMYGMKEEEFLTQFGGVEMVKYDLQMREAIEILKK